MSARQLPAMRSSSDSKTSLLGAAGAFAGTAYVLVLIAMPVVEPGFDALRAHPEAYASGQYGVLVNVSYVALALGLAAVAADLLPRGRWSRLALLLLAPPIGLCLALAIDPIRVAGQPATPYAVVALAAGPLAVSLAFRERFRASGRWVVGLAGAVLVAFIALAMAPSEISGFVNRAFDVAIGVWVIVAGLSGARQVAPLAPS